MWFVFYQSRFEYKQKICEVQKNDLPLHHTLLYKSAILSVLFASLMKYHE